MTADQNKAVICVKASGEAEVFVYAPRQVLEILDKQTFWDGTMLSGVSVAVPSWSTGNPFD